MPNTLNAICVETLIRNLQIAPNRACFYVPKGRSHVYTWGWSVGRVGAQNERADPDGLARWHALREKGAQQKRKNELFATSQALMEVGRSVNEES